MKSPGAVALADLMRPARRKIDELAHVGSMPIAEMAATMLEQIDAVSMETTGLRCCPERLGDMARQAERLAEQFRLLAIRRQQEAS